jgi:hypothetical protein
MMNSEYKNKILSAIWSLFYDQQHPLEGRNSLLKKSPDLTELNDFTELNKQIFFPLTHLHSYRKESLLKNRTAAYLNSVHPTKLRVNLNESLACLHKPSKQKQQPGLTVAPSKTSDVIYEYLKTFSKYSERKKGVLINYNQHIAYNFNSKNQLLRGVEPLNNNSKKTRLAKLGTNENKSTNDVPFTTAFLLKKEKVAKTNKNINKNINTNTKNLLNKHLLGLYPETTKNTPIHPFANTNRTKEPNAPKRVHIEEIPRDYLLILNRLNRLKGVSGETGYNRKGNNRLIKYSYKLLFYFFKSMYCLISKPVFLFTPEKVVIQLLYFINIPKFKVFKWYSIFRNKRIIKRREARIKKIKKIKKIKQIKQIKQLPLLIHQKQIKQIKSLEKDNLKLHSVAELVKPTELARNHIENLSSIHTFNSDGRKRKYTNQKVNKKKRKVTRLNWKLSRTLIRLQKKRTKVQNTLFNLNKYNLFKVFSLKFKLICEILNNKFKKPVELQLIRIHQPYQDSNILVNLLSLNIKNKKFKTNVQIAKLFQKINVKNISDTKNKSVNFIPNYLSGINLRIGGRLMRETLIPRKSKKRFEKGARSIGKVNYLDSASITNKNRKGSYTLKISLGQNFF